jgi:hypothetical protein
LGNTLAKRMTDDELRALTDSEIRQSMGFMGGKLSEQRRKAEYYYLGKAQGDLAPPQVDGRSAVVSTDVADTIEWMLPSLLKIFASSDTAVEFTPQKPEDEKAAKQATDYINYIFYKQNPGFNLLYTWFKDALLQKVGVLKVHWDVSDNETKEDYKGLTDEELTLLLQDENVEPIAHNQYPDEVAAQQIQESTQNAAMMYQQAMANPPQSQPGQPPAPPPQPPAPPPPVPNLHDVTIKRTEKKGKVIIEAVPPEEFGISKRSKHITDGFCYHRVQRTIGELRASGYKNIDDLTDDDQGSNANAEMVERRSFDDENVFSNDHDEGSDPSMRVVWITECFMPVDYDGDGIPEWRKIVRAGNQILENEECDGPPFVSLTPIPLPHRFFGLSIADLAMETQRIKTSLLRSVMDNLYMSVNGRYFAVDNQVNLDDLLTSRPGGIVRVKTPGAVGRLDAGMSDPAGAYQMLEYMETMRENRTGWTRNSQGGDPNAINKTATGISIVTNRSDSRLELIARVFAETGMKDLFLMILKLVSQHQDKAAVMRLNNEWIDVDPSEWKTQFDFAVNVGLGTGNKDQQVQHLMGLMQVQEKALQIGVANPQNIYNAASKLAENMGFKNSDAMFTDPSKTPPQPPQPHPEQIKMQGMMQIEQMKAQTAAQSDSQRLQAESQAKMAEISSNHQAKLAEIQAGVQAEEMKQTYQAQQSQHQNELEAQRALQVAQMEAQLAEAQRQHDAVIEQQKMAMERWRVELEQATKITIAQIAAQASSDSTLMAAQFANTTVTKDL